MNILNKNISKCALRNKKILENIPKGFKEFTLIKFAQKNLLIKLNNTKTSLFDNNISKKKIAFNKTSKFNFSESK